jgi:hypothetical protein
VKIFSQLGAPLIYLTKKGMFIWPEEVHVAFDKMNKVMRTFLVLALPFFS